MSKATLEFNLPEEREEHKIAINAMEYYSMLDEVRLYVRTLRKYDERTTVPKSEIIDKLTELLYGFD